MPNRAKIAQHAHLLPMLSAGRMIVWSCELSSREIAHAIPAQLWRLPSLPQPLSLRAALRLVHPDDRHEAIERARVALRQRTPYVQHLRIVLEGPSQPIWMECHGRIITDESGSATCLEAVMVDITAHRKAVDALEEADRRKDEFLATLAHELRNPLTAIGAVSQLLSIRSVDAAELKTCVDMIRRQTKQLSRLAEDLIDLTHVVRDDLTFKRELIDLRESINTAIEATEEALKARGHILTVAMPQPEHGLPLEGDAVRLGQLFGNLLTNAIKYTPNGGSIVLTAELAGSWASVRVRDSGIGISAEHLPHVFEPFYRADNSLARRQEGLGIGLALSHRIALMHGGSISVHSPGTGKGTEFVVRLPLRPEKSGSAAGSEGELSGVAPGVARVLRILIAEDSADVANALALALRMMGHEVTVVLDGEKALETADRIHPQVALLDIDMPKRNGQEVAAQIRTRGWAAQHSVLLAGLTGWNIRELGGFDLTAFDAMILKPPRMEEIGRLIERHLHGAVGTGAGAAAREGNLSADR